MGIDFWLGEKSLAGGESTEGRGGKVFPGREGMSKFSAGGRDSPHSPSVGKTLYAVTPNRMIYLLFHDHKPLIMYQSDYHQKWIKDTRRQTDIKFCPLLSIRKFPVQTWLGVWTDFRNSTLLYGSKISVKTIKWYDWHRVCEATPSTVDQIWLWNRQIADKKNYVKKGSQSHLTDLSWRL